MTLIFRNWTIFWDISKWNRGQTKWDGGSIYFSATINAIEIRLKLLGLRVRNALPKRMFCVSSFFFFFFLPKYLTFSVNSAWCAMFTDPQISLFSNFFIKNRSHGTIHIFKNYFTTVFFILQFSAVSKRTLYRPRRKTKTPGHYFFNTFFFFFLIFATCHHYLPPLYSQVFFFFFWDKIIL